jgi:cell wall-associated NlpC family hydrolase
MASVLAACAIAAPSSALASSQTGGVGALGFQFPTGGVTQPDLGTLPGQSVTTVSPDRRSATPPATAPAAVKKVIRTANLITGKPYKWGGGHRRFIDSAYDCSGAVSFALHGGGLLLSPLDSTAFTRWGQPGPGSWITVYANRRHAYVVIAGLRFDTSGPGASGPRWRPMLRSSQGFTARHFPGL